MSRNNTFTAIALVAAFIGLCVVAPPASVYAAANDEVFSAGEPGDAQMSARIASVTIKDADGRLVFDPAVVKVRLGEQIRFVVTNAGQLDHEFFLGSPEEISEHKDMMKKMPGMEHNDANVIRLKPGETKEIAWHFTKPGDFEYACLLPGHLEAGMVGKVSVERGD
jgi:uncharacterized cupredoxin-like copper-binding protein